MPNELTPSPGSDRMRALLAQAHGGPKVLAIEQVAARQPAPGEVLIEVSDVGINFIDVYQREGIYPGDAPFIMGNEGAGVVTQVGAEVDTFAPGQLVAWPMHRGSAAEQVCIPAASVVSVPEGVSAPLAAASMLQGLTAHYLTRSTHVIEPGQVALVHAAAGGVGQLLVQMITAAGAVVIATAGTEAKCEIARQLGAQTAINYTGLTPEALTQAVREAAPDGVDVVYDGVGQATFEASLASLKPRGLLVLFGASSGQVPPLDLQRLNTGGSLYVTRPSLGHYIASPDELRWRSSEIFQALGSGSLTVSVGGQWPLDQAAQAYAALEGRTSTGKLLLSLRPDTQ